jgi:ribosomal protein S18 acetylase RimI-like enzyme
MIQVYTELEGFPKEDEQPEYYKLLRNIGSMTERPDTTLLVAVDSSDRISGAVLYVGDIAHYGGGGIAGKEVNTAGFRLLAVDPNTRNRGIGKTLTQACIDHAKKQNKIQLILHTTHSMQTAWRMYERMGFSRSEDLDFMQGNLAVLGFRMKF